MATMLRRLSAGLRHVAAAAETTRFLSSAPRRLLSSSVPLLRQQLQPPPFHAMNSSTHPRHQIGGFMFLPSPPLPQSQMIVRWKSSERRVRAPDTPVKSKIKKYKIKGYSSYKRRFKPLNDGTIRRWKEGNAHNAYCKSHEQKRRLRKPALVSLAYAKVMKKLNFFG